MSTDDEAKQRVAHNEVLFREINERIEAGHWPGEEGAGTAFRCECGDLGCNVMLELASAEYERVRAHPRCFIVALGHNVPEVEMIVERAANYLVVEKLAEAGRIAESQDPRD